MDSINKVNKLNKSDFLSIFGNVFEKNEWIAEKTFNFRPFKNFEELFFNMIEIFEKAKKSTQHKIFNSHPELVVEKKLTNQSKKEQIRSSLNQCSNLEVKEFKKLNKEYKKKFGFPFIIAVKGKNRKEILKNFKQRVSNNIDEEFKEAKNQVKKIATFRLEEIIK